MQLFHGYFIKPDILLARWQLLTVIDNLKKMISGNNKSLCDICIICDGHYAMIENALMCVAHPLRKTLTEEGTCGPTWVIESRNDVAA